MKAKDTVMDSVTKRQFWIIRQRSVRDTGYWDIDGALELQAEISFEEGRKAGIREAVEAIKSIGLDKVSVRDDVLERKWKEWEAKLKEWGLK